ncbi:LSU ribosomal protein L16p (L10e) [Candidatus Vidania fulgoroideae]|nr:LSU ribosomal protein L16p (L10e) [Candidatus Vidania fulgoroideae]
MKKKFRKTRKGRNRGISNNSNKISFLEYALKSLENGVIDEKQIESGRKVLTRFVRKFGKVIIRIKPNVPITKKPIEVRMGSGKGEVDKFIFKIKPGNIIYELDCLYSKEAFKALRLCSMKMPFRTKIIKRDFFQ